MLKKELVKSISKWKDEGFDISDADWCKIFELPYKTKKNQNITGCNLRSSTGCYPQISEKLKLIDSNLCTVCKLVAETIEHLFVDCPYVKEI